MQFQVPQFIDVENKIIGPLSLRQFLYLAGAGLISFMLFFIIQMWLWFLISVFLTIIALALALIKYNGKPLPEILWLAMGFIWRPRLYLWQREVEEKFIEIPTTEAVISKREKLEKFFSETPNIKKLWQNLLTTKNPVPKREKTIRTPFWGKKPKEKFQLFRKITGEKEIAKRVDYR
ncbi:MAG TPA: PrgI family protein [Candidatus Wolfebacteria bacterium]|nr:PrgI family protein [Candidatus Wolfebacteria bacterium]